MRPLPLLFLLVVVATCVFVEYEVAISPLPVGLKVLGFVGLTVVTLLCAAIIARYLDPNERGDDPNAVEPLMVAAPD